MVLALALVHILTQDSVLIGDHPKERHLRNVRQLTFGGQNAEAYWNMDGSQIVYQSRQPEYPDEQIFVMNADGSNKRLISTGLGRTTCGYFAPNGGKIYFSSTHEKDKGAQKPLDFSKGYVWMVNPNFSLYRSDPDGKNLEKLVDKNAYVAETTIAPNGRFLTFTSNFEGDLEIYRAGLDGRNIRRLTRNVGYDGGPFVSWDGKKIVYRRYDLKSPEEVADYKALLAEHLVRPGKLEIYMMNADGSGNRRVTDLGCGSFAPFLHPDGKRIIFTSNFGDKRGREFELWMIGSDGANLERVTYSAEFDGFPMFSRDGKKVVWASNRNGKVRGETNIFVADWVE
jgi:Tol biopolymer transport system component